MSDLQLTPLALHGTPDTRPLIIAGPCSAETEEQVLTTALQLAGSGVRIFRAGIWKPRTRPGCFEGIGALALPWMQRVKAETGMLVTTEVATPDHVEAALAAGIDILWIGARTTASPFAMQDLADCLRGTDIPILVKNPVNPDIELWVGALQRLNRAGLTRLAAIHRGFSSVDQRLYRNAPMWHMPIELKRRYPDLPILCDPSHMGGRRDLVAPLAQQAMDLGLDGLMIESHCRPDEAWSDARQQVLPEVLDIILHNLVVRDTIDATESLAALRKQIDELDNTIMDQLARRMAVSREIAEFKKQHNMTIVQTSRYSEILDRRGAQGLLNGMPTEFVKRIFEAIHSESVRQQIEILHGEEEKQ